MRKLYIWSMGFKPVHLVEQCWWQGQLQLCSDFRRRIILPCCRFGWSDILIVLLRNVATCYNRTLYNQHTATTKRLIDQATAHSTSWLKSLSISPISTFLLVSTRYTLHFVTKLRCTKYFVRFALFNLLFIVFLSNYPIHTTYPIFLQCN